MQEIKNERSLGELFAELMGETSTLVRQEIVLAKTEITQKATRAGKQVGFLVVGGAVAYAALLVLLAAVVMGLAEVMPAWVAALLVGAATAAVAYLLVTKALAALKAADLTSSVTVETLKEDAQWVKGQMG